MTNIGGPGFFFLVYGLVMAAGTPVVVAAWLGILRATGMGVVRAFLLVNGAIFVVGLTMVTLWTMPFILSSYASDAFQYIGIYVGTALGIIVLFEAIPLGLGIWATVTYREAPRHSAAYASAAGWILGAILGLLVGVLVAPGFLAILGVIPGSLIGAVLGGPAVFSRFGGGNIGGSAGLSGSAD